MRRPIYGSNDDGNGGGDGNYNGSSNGNDNGGCENETTHQL